MKVRELFEKQSYDNWIRYNDASVKADFDEYKLKEKTKWQSRSRTIGSRFPIFDSLDQFRDALDNAKIVDIDSLGDVLNLTKNDSIGGIKDMVSSYYMPRDVDRIVHGLQTGAKLPLPIIIRGDKKMWILAGNTRQATARVLGFKPAALLVDVAE